MLANNEDKLLEQKGISPINRKRTRMGKCAFLNQETYWPTSDRFVNLYWLEIPKSTYKFSLINDFMPNSLLKFTEKFYKEISPNLLGSINTCNLYLTDKGRVPKVQALNLYVSQGKVLQFPSNSRVSLIERQGKLSIRFLKAEGEMAIGNIELKWIGAKNYKNLGPNNGCDAIIYGVSDIRFKYENSIRKARIAIRKTTMLNCFKDRILLGVDLNKKGQVSVAKKSTKPLSLFDYLYVIETDKRLQNDITVGDLIHKVVIDNYTVRRHDNAVTLSFTLPKKAKSLRKIITREVIPSYDGKIKPLEKGFFKAWSIIFFTKSKVIFFLADSFPFIENQSGLNIYELHDLLTQKFDFVQAAVCDAGQSSKLCVKDKNNGFSVFGNLHYIDFTGAKPKWNGINGRNIPSVLIAHQ